MAAHSCHVHCNNLSCVTLQKLQQRIVAVASRAPLSMSQALKRQ